MAQDLLSNFLPLDFFSSASRRLCCLPHDKTTDDLVKMPFFITTKSE
jgi:hypothetical protein